MCRSLARTPSLVLYVRLQDLHLNREALHSLTAPGLIIQLQRQSSTTKATPQALCAPCVKLCVITQVAENRRRCPPHGTSTSIYVTLFLFRDLCLLLDAIVYRYPAKLLRIEGDEAFVEFDTFTEDETGAKKLCDWVRRDPASFGSTGAVRSVAKQPFQSARCERQVVVIAQTSQQPQKTVYHTLLEHLVPLLFPACARYGSP